MILYLFLSILFATTLFIILKLFKTYQVNTNHGILINYFIASALAFVVNLEDSSAALLQFPKLLPVTMSIGLLFILVFNITGISSQKAGISVTSVAAKMSMVIPIVFGVILYNDHINFTRIIGMVTALIAVYIINKPTTQTNSVGSDFWLPILVFIGSGIVDTSIKYAQHFYMNQENRQLLISMLFGSAGILGIVHYFFQYLAGTSKKISLQSIIGGVVLGIANYFSLHFLFLCFEYPGSESAMIFAIVNIGVVLLAAIAGYLLLKESISSRKLSGIIIAIFSIIILYTSR